MKYSLSFTKFDSHNVPQFYMGEQIDTYTNKVEPIKEAIEHLENRVYDGATICYFDDETKQFVHMISFDINLKTGDVI